MDFDDHHVPNERLERALRDLEQGEVALRDATTRLERRLNEHARRALESGLIGFDSSLLAHRR